MPTKACLDNVKAKGGEYCGSSVCDPIQGDINEYCKHTGIGGDVPVPQYNGGKKCYCCCSCFSFNTPIQVSTNEFRLVQDLKIGDKVLATGPELTNWVEREITDAAGIAKGVRVDFMYYTALLFDDTAEPVERQIITSADHLFLDVERKLKPAQDLRPGDKVMRADGGTATVVFNTPGQFDGGVRSIMLGDYSGGPLDGHLVNANGIVTADFSVQSWYYNGKVPAELLAGDAPKGPTPGSPAYLAAMQNDAMLSFLSDEDQWPEAFKPVPPSLINIPVNASRFLTAEQAQDILETLPSFPYGNSYSLAIVTHLFRLYRGFFPDVLFVIDWQNEEPNGFYFEDFAEKYIVVTGGLARLKALSESGISIILSQLIAVSGGHKCVAEADYYGVFLFLREVWFDEKFFDVYIGGMNEINALFNAIKQEHAQPDPKDICKYPGIECRRKALEAGAAMSGVPECAVPLPDFRVVSAKADADLSEVVVEFSKSLNPPSARSSKNYTITPTVEVRKAAYVQANPQQVILRVRGLEAGGTYMLEVNHVLDKTGKLISPEGNKAQFETDRA